MLASLAFALYAPLQLLGQAWSPFLDPTRAIDWTSAGFTIPNYTVNCATQPSLLAGSGNAVANGNSLRASVASCDATHNVVNIAAGMWYFDFLSVQQSKVVIRGAGPNSTTLIPTVGTGCAGGQQAGICLFEPNDISFGSAAVLPGGTQACNSWSAGYAQGTTSISLTGCGGTPPLNGLLALDQANDTSDTSGVYICDDTTTNCPLEVGGAEDGRIISGITHSQQQYTKITGVTSLGGGAYTVTISPGVYFTNVRSGQSPGAFWFDTLLNVGVENLTMDGSTMSAGHPTDFGNMGTQQCFQCWFKNVRSENAGRYHIEPALSFQTVVRDSYFFGSVGGGASQSYGIEMENSSADLDENNIFQQVTAPIVVGGGNSGNVYGYNYSIDNIYTAAPSFMQATYANHNAGNEMNLWEGNSFNGDWADIIHGSSTQQTLFRNMLIGWQIGKTNTTVPYIARSFNRAYNVVGNVLGQPGYHTQYESFATSSTTFSGTENTSIYNLGEASDDTCTAGSLTNGCDVRVRNTMMRWGNYDVVTAGTKFDSTEASPGAVTFVAANFSSGYFSTLAHTLPASLYYSSTPSWWPAGKVFPPVDVNSSGGNVGICTGGTYAGAQATSAGQCGAALTPAWGSHVTSIPAQDCFLATMGGPPDGSGAARSFDASVCYAPSGATWTLSTATNGTGSGTIACVPSGSGISAGTGYSCTLVPAAGSVIGAVSGCGGSGTTTYTGAMPAANCTVTATFQGTVAVPTFSPAPGGYGSAQTITLADTVAGATIGYTIDGSTPTASAGTITHGTTYSGPFPVSVTTTVKVIGSKATWTSSGVGTGVYTINGAVADPIFAPIADTYASALPITIATSTPGSTIRYTTDGTTPTSSHGTIYTAGVSMGSTATLKAIAYQTGFTDSSVVSGAYTISGSPNILFKATLSSNANSSGIVLPPNRKQLGNVGTGCSGGVIQPTGVPVGQLYATAAIRTAAIAAGCATQNAVTVTSSGVGIQAMDNGQNSGGTDSPVTVTDTYGNSTYDSLCTGDPNNALATGISGLAPLTCVANSSLVVAESTAASHGNSDVLWPTDYATNSTSLDSALYYYRDMYWIPDNVSTLHDWEFDVNINSSPTAYAGSTGAYAGWGFDWGAGATMFRAALQGQPWTVLQGVDVAGGPPLTSYPLITGHLYHTRNFGHRRAGCTATSGSSCIFYDYLAVNDVTAGSAPKLYAVTDSATGLPVGGLPVNHSTWASGPDVQVQIDMTAAAASTQVRVISDTTEYYGATAGTSFTWTVTATNGSLTGLNCAGGSYLSGNTIGDCTAVPNAGYTFTGWSGVSGSAACSGVTNPCPSFTLGANSAATANFSNSYTLSTATAGGGTGTISGCAGSHTFGASYSCTVAATGGSTIASVSGCGGSGTTTFAGTMPASNCTVTATFNPAPGATKVSISGTAVITTGPGGVIQ